MPWHVPQHMHCGMWGTAGTLLMAPMAQTGRQLAENDYCWLLLQLESRQVIFWVSVHFLNAFKPAPNLPRPLSVAVLFFLYFLSPPSLFAGTVAYSDSFHFFLLKQPQGRLTVARDMVNACDIMPPKTIPFISGVMLLKSTQPGWEQDTSVSHEFLWEEFSLKEVFLKK